MLQQLCCGPPSSYDRGASRPTATARRQPRPRELALRGVTQSSAPSQASNNGRQRSAVGLLATEVPYPAIVRDRASDWFEFEHVDCDEMRRLAWSESD
jgi:hypothetical protein